MSTRTTSRTVRFKSSFSFSEGDIAYPAGHYLVDTDEVLIESLSFPVWHRVATMIHVSSGGNRQVLTIDPRELERLLSIDAESGGD